jgi:hypothetical protein
MFRDYSIQSDEKKFLDRFRLSSNPIWLPGQAIDAAPPQGIPPIAQKSPPQPVAGARAASSSTQLSALALEVTDDVHAPPN